jgi:hypothetical protein
VFLYAAGFCSYTAEWIHSVNSHAIEVSTDLRFATGHVEKGNMGTPHSQQEQQIIQQHEIHALAQDVSEMKSLMSKMVDAISRIGLLDERQQTVTAALQKLDDRTSRIEVRQQDAEIARAVNQQSADRLNLIDTGFRELHIERERDKARFQTVIWMIRGLWATVTAGGLGVALKIYGGV